MLLSKKIFLVLAGIILFLNVLILSLFIQNRQNLSSQIDRLHNSRLYLEHKLIESVSLNYSMLGRRLDSFQDGVTGSGSIVGSEFEDSLRSSYLIVFSTYTCPPCIPEALSIAAKLFPQESGNRFFVVSNYSNPLGLFILMEQNGLNRQNGIHSNKLAESLVGNLQTPILLKINDSLIVEKACYLEKELPSSFYQRFIVD